MKYPNPKFAGMSQVTNAAIAAKIKDYYPNPTQKGGAQRLALLNNVTTLSGLIDYCIEGYRAWADAVLMGAGAYLKIGEFPSEIAAAKDYIRQEVSNYLAGAPFATESEYDRWHRNICLTITDNTKFFVDYSAYRKDSKDKFTNKYGFTVGNAQKFLNMLMKDLYACLNQKPNYLPGYEDYFQYCHMPLDSYILRFVDDIRWRENIKKPARRYTWSNLSNYDAYLDEQKDIRNYVKKYNASATVLQTEFVVWPLYK
jgi:hypothetical protein